MLVEGPVCPKILPYDPRNFLIVELKPNLKNCKGSKNSWEQHKFYISDATRAREKAVGLDCLTSQTSVTPTTETASSGNAGSKVEELEVPHICANIRAVILWACVCMIVCAWHETTNSSSTVHCARLERKLRIVQPNDKAQVSEDSWTGEGLTWKLEITWGICKMCKRTLSPMLGWCFLLLTAVVLVVLVCRFAVAYVRHHEPRLSEKKKDKGVPLPSGPFWACASCP